MDETSERVFEVDSVKAHGALGAPGGLQVCLFPPHSFFLLHLFLFALLLSCLPAEQRVNIWSKKEGSRAERLTRAPFGREKDEEDPKNTGES